MSDEQVWLDRAVDLAVANVADSGGPFGAVVVLDGLVIGEGVNHVTRDLDPTAHAEVVAIRAACHSLEEFSLTGATLYASCEPCPMCTAAALWARVAVVAYAADRAAAARAGFDDDAFHQLLRADGPRAQWPMQLVHHPTPRAEEPFDAWRARADRIAY